MATARGGNELCFFPQGGPQHPLVGTELTGTWLVQRLFFFNPYVSAAPPFAYEAEGELLRLVCGLVLKVLSQGKFW